MTAQIEVSFSIVKGNTHLIANAVFPCPPFLRPIIALRHRIDSQSNDARGQTQTQYSQTPATRGRTGSGVYEAGRTAGHAPPISTLLITTLTIPTPSGAAFPSSNPRSRTDSDISCRAPGIARAASPAQSDRAPTPTQSLAQSRGSETRGWSEHPAAPARHQSQPSVRLITRSGPGLSQPSAAAGIVRKTSPLSQQSSLASSSASNRSVTPTQSSAFASAELAGGPDDASDITASDRPTGHRNTPSNASSNMTSSSSSNNHSGTSSKSPGLFRSKLRKALSLSELNNYSSSSDIGRHEKKVGGASLTSHSSSSDTSHSTAEPRTPPNGTSPVLPSTYTSSSATNLSTGAGRQGFTISGSSTLPQNGGRRFGILNSKVNASTDNISISSTVSSASVMLRKMASFGKLGRKNSVRSISNIFNRSDKSSDYIANDAISEFGVPGAAMASSKDRKKGGLANPSVAHVTVEMESGADSGMTPAAALVRKHREKERLQQEADAVRRRAAGTPSAIPLPPSTDSPKSKLLVSEKEKLKNASGKRSTGRKWGLGAFNRTASSTSLNHDAAAGVSRSPSPPSSAAPSPIFDSPANTSGETSIDSQSPVQETNERMHKEYAHEPVYQPSLDNVELDTWRRNAPVAYSSNLPAEAMEFGDKDVDVLANEDAEPDDQTPSNDVTELGELHDDSFADWDGEPPSTSFFEDDTASIKLPEGETTARYFPTPAVEDMYDDGGADGRSGQKIPERPPAHARPTKGILKRKFTRNICRGINLTQICYRCQLVQSRNPLSPPTSLPAA